MKIRGRADTSTRFPAETLVVGEVLFLLKNPVDDYSNADTALAGSGQELLEWRG
jgi:hypothetical protein